MAISKVTLIRNICLGLYFFLCGVEYAVILPTLNDYLGTLNADTTFLGIVLATFSFAGLVTAPIYGYISDKTRSLKACIVVGNILEIAGNFMYFVGRSKYYIWVGRLLAGLGSGAISSIFGAMSRSTSEKDRTAAFAIFMMLRQIGIVIGPGFNAFLLVLNFKIGPFEVNEYTSPGLFMTALWTLHTILFLFAYKESRQVQENEDVLTNSQQEEAGLHEDHVVNGSAAQLHNQEDVKFKVNFVQDFLREEIIVLLAAAFICAMVQTGIEAAVTPMSALYFDWHGLENTFLLLGAGVVVIIGFGLVRIATKHFSDRTLMLGGCIGLSFGYAVLLVSELFLFFVPNNGETPPWFLPIFCADLVIWVISLAFLFVPQVSLFSKLTRPETQAFNQGIRIVSTRIGMILGPLWAAPMVTPTRFPIMAGVNFGLLCLMTSMVIGSFKHLVSREQTENHTNDDLSETSPLLNQAG